MKALVKLFNSFSPEHSVYNVFSDFLDLAACSISCRVDLTTRDEREERYMSVIGKYKPRDQALFPEVFAAIADELENPRDVLGELFSELELYSTAAGQFFTPYHLSVLMARALINDSIEETIRKRGRVSVLEPACGAGGMVIALTQAMREKGYNPQRQMFASCGDIDLRAVQMTYIQLSLLGISAVIEHKNALTLKTFSPVWRTPAYMLGPVLFLALAEQRAEAEAEEGQLRLFV